MSDDDDFDPEGAEADWVSDHYIQSGAFDDEFYWKHSRERTRQYLMDHGDDLQKRVDSLLTEATVLAKEGHSSSALVMAMTCVELICRDLILRPLLRGLPLDDFADAMMDQLLGGRMSARVRTAVIPDLLESQGLRLSGDESMGRLVKDLAMTDGANLWKRLNGSSEQTLAYKRNAVVHEGEAASARDATLGLEAASLLLERVVAVVAAHYSLPWVPGGSWLQPDGP